MKNMRSQLVDILEIKPHTDTLYRVKLENEMSCDVPQMWFSKFSQGDRIKIEVADANAELNGDLVLNGCVYDSDDHHMFVSCGGLIWKIAGGECVGTSVRVSLTKSRRRRRPL